MKKDLMMRRANVMKSRLKFGAIIAGLVMAGAACGDTITLKNAVRLDRGDRVVHLGDIARLDGALAEDLADLEIASVEPNDDVLEISIRAVRDRLDARGVHWGRLMLNGRSVTVRPGRAASDATVLAMQGASIAATPFESDRKPGKEAHTAETLITQDTLRGSIAQFIAEGLRRRAADVRITFNPDDAEILDRSTPGFRVEIEPNGSLASDRLGLNLRLWSGARVVERHTLNIGLAFRETTATAARDIDRNELIRESDFQLVSDWMKPSEFALAADPAEVIGRVASSRIKAGQVIHSGDVTRETLIRRGDLVTVRCLIGGTVISIQAEARQDGREGDSIEFRKRGERDTFLATVASAGEAVVDLSENNEPRHD